MRQRKLPQPAASAETPPGNNGFSLISSGKLIALYRAMVQARMIRERAALVMKNSKVGCDSPVAMGREATLAGVAVDLLPGDILSLSRSDFAAGFIKGVPLEQMFRGLATHRNGNGTLHMLPPASTIGVQLGVACGVALTWKAKQEGRIAVALCEEAVDSIQCLSETLNFAAHHQLPILFVCHRGMDDESVRIKPKKQKAGDEALAFGIPAIAVDGNDVVAVYRVASESIARARQGHGPTLIECRRQPAARTHRNLAAGASDPIDIMEAYLKSKGLFHPQLKPEIARAFREELDAATRFLSN